MKAQVYTLDAFIAGILLLTTMLTLSMLKPNYTLYYKPPDEILGVLLKNEDFVHAIYSLDASRLEHILNAYLGRTPYNLTIFDYSGKKLLSVGQEVEGLAAVAILCGVNGTLEPLIVCLKVGG